MVVNFEVLQWDESKRTSRGHSNIKKKVFVWIGHNSKILTIIFIDKLIEREKYHIKILNQL